MPGRPDVDRKLRSRRAGYVWLSLAAAVVLLASAVWPPSDLPHVPICPVKRWVGIPCPGCGLTRSFCAISHARFGLAVDCNPFGYFFYAAAAVALLWPLIVRVFPATEARRSRVRRLAFLVPILVLAMYVFGVARAMTLLL